MPRRGMGQATRPPRYPGLLVDSVWEGSDQECAWILPGSRAKREVTELLLASRQLTQNLIFKNGHWCQLDLLGDTHSFGRPMGRRMRTN
jgi:hypothetical protein